MPFKTWNEAWSHVTSGSGTVTLSGNDTTATCVDGGPSDRAYLQREVMVAAGDEVVFEVMGYVTSGTPSVIIDYPTPGNPYITEEIVGADLRSYRVTFKVPETWDDGDYVFINVGVFTADTGTCVLVNPIIYLNGVDIDRVYHKGFKEYLVVDQYDSNAAIRVQRDGSAQFELRSLANTTGEVGRYKWQATSDANNLFEAGVIFLNVSDVSDGAEDTEMYFRTRQSGVVATRMSMGAGVWLGNPYGTNDKGAGTLNAEALYDDGVRTVASSGSTGGTGSAGAGNQYVAMVVNGTTYKVLHDGTV